MGSRVGNKPESKEHERRFLANDTTTNHQRQSFSSCGSSMPGLDTSSPAFVAATMKMTGLEQQTSILIVWWTCPDNPAWFHENRP
jgi:hypothetical protein